VAVEPTIVQIDQAATMGALTQRPAVEPTAVMATKRVPTTVRVAPPRVAEAPRRAPRAPMRAAARVEVRCGPCWQSSLFLGCGAGFFLWQRHAAFIQSTMATPNTTALPVPSTTLVSADTPSAAPLPTLEPIIPPASDLATIAGAMTTSLKTAQAAFRRGDYDTAMARAQEALREKPSTQPLVS